MISRYRPRTLEHLRQIMQPLGALAEVLDFGSGDGYFAAEVRHWPQVRALSAVDVVERPQSHVQPVLYDGRTLPFEDGRFDLSYAVDVLHHCPEPLAAIDEILRCTSRFLLIKDHTQDGPIGKLTLAVLDELGNRRFGIPSTYRYQQGWSWCDYIESRGWTRRVRIAALPCHSGALGWLTNRLQFVALWERDRRG